MNLQVEVGEEKVPQEDLRGACASPKVGHHQEALDEAHPFQVHAWAKVGPY